MSYSMILLYLFKIKLKEIHVKHLNMKKKSLQNLRLYLSIL